jgi:hypothetical protein
MMDAIHDVITNRNEILNPDSRTKKVHRGFLEVYLSLKTDLQSHLARLAEKYPYYNIVFTGHSLGGALAVLGAVDFAETSPAIYQDRMSVVSYGAPRYLRLLIIVLEILNGVTTCPRSPSHHISTAWSRKATLCPTFPLRSWDMFIPLVSSCLSPMAPLASAITNIMGRRMIAMSRSTHSPLITTICTMVGTTIGNFAAV